MTNELATTQPTAIAQQQANQLGDLWRHAKMLAGSDIIPAAYRNKPENCVVAIELAQRMGSSPMLVMQNLDIIQGKPSWSSKFLIATVNACGRFTPLRFRFDGKPGTKDWSCTACATEKSTGELLEGVTVSMAMADAEGWFGKQGSKWKTMPQLMLTYRAAAFWSRIYCPEVAMGLHTSEESEDASPAFSGMPDDIRESIAVNVAPVAIPALVVPEEQPSKPMREPGED